jgi:hypothetical protein
MDSIVLLSRDPSLGVVIAIAGLVCGVIVARKFLRPKKVHDPTSSSGSPPQHFSMSVIAILQQLTVTYLWPTSDSHSF